MKEIDKIHTENPGRGVLGMVLDLTAMGLIVGPKRVRRLMRKMQIQAVMPRRCLSKKYRPEVCPSLPSATAENQSPAACLVD